MKGYGDEQAWRDRLYARSGITVAAAIVDEADRLSLTTAMPREDARRIAEEAVQAELNRRTRGDA